ncbi:hypothetical protein E8E14_003618 [Neopestalotiopsis sp. 37M]|nr:hypothetical protein E8E14_003618 [Neopestalotiopsis sp. 37M]
MSPIECAATEPVTQTKCNQTLRPSPCPSVAGIEHELKDLAVADDGNIAKYPPSLDTDSTLSAHTAFNHELMAKTLESISFILDETLDPVHTQGLTQLALQAHDLKTKDLGYARDLASWCRDGNILDRSDRDAELTDSMLVTKRSKSRATEYTTSSFDMLSDFGAAADTDYAVNGAGAAFHEIPTPQMEDEPILSTHGMI